MHEAVNGLDRSIVALGEAIDQHLPNSQGINLIWSGQFFPGSDKGDIKELLDECRTKLAALPEQGFSDNDIRYLKEYPSRIQTLIANSLPHFSSNAHLVVLAINETLKSVSNFADILNEKAEAPTLTLAKAARRVRSLEGQLSALEPRFKSLELMLQRIERAYEAAEQLPADLETLREARQAVLDARNSANVHIASIEQDRNSSSQMTTELRAKHDEATGIVERLDTAYAAATSQGLSQAFYLRAHALSRSLIYWVCGLAAALFACVAIGYFRLNALLAALNTPSVQAFHIVMHAIASVIAIGAPVWFAWLATKQIGQRFRLAEDYSFKASVARAYEGFRKEAVRIDPELQAQLLKSALSRLDEQPLRFVEPSNHGSPVQELLNSEAVREALKAVPGLAKEMKDFAISALSRTNTRQTTANSGPPTSSPLTVPPAPATPAGPAS